MRAHEDSPVGASPLAQPLHRPPVRAAQRPLGRRALLGGGLAVGAMSVLSGCTVGGRPEPLPPVHEPTPGADPDVVVAGDTLAAERTMLQRLQAAMARHRGLRPLLTPVAAVHEAHVALLTRAVPGSAPSPAPSATGSPGRPETSSDVPRKPDHTVRWLAGHENDLSLFDKQQAFTARSGAFARLLASMAAAAAQQAVLLGHPAHRHAGPGHRHGGAR